MWFSCWLICFGLRKLFCLLALIQYRNPLVHWWIEHKLGGKNNSFVGFLGFFYYPLIKHPLFYDICALREIIFMIIFPVLRFRRRTQLVSVWVPGYMRENGGSEADKKRMLSCYRHEGPPEEQPSCSPSNWSCCFGVVPVAPVWQIANPKIDLAASAGKNIVFCPKLRGGIRKTEAFSTETA